MSNRSFAQLHAQDIQNSIVNVTIHGWCEGTLGVKKSSEETVGIALN